jgi:hypothetical protein
MKRESWSISISTAALLLVSVYQNCSQTGTSSNPYYDTATLASLAASCDPQVQACPTVAPDPNSLFLAIRTSNPLVLQKTDTSFDVSGDCSGYGYAMVTVHWTFNDTNNNVLSTGEVLCDTLGHFTLNITLPAAYVHTQTSTVTAQAFGRATSNPSEVPNPSGAATGVLQVTGASN